MCPILNNLCPVKLHFGTNVINIFLIVGPIKFMAILIHVMFGLRTFLLLLLYSKQFRLVSWVAKTKARF